MKSIMLLGVILIIGWVLNKLVDYALKAAKVKKRFMVKWRDS